MTVMSSKWLRSSSDVLISDRSRHIGVVRLLHERQIGQYNKNQFNFIQYYYYNCFPVTTPRYIVISRNNESYETLEFKFHSKCVNGC